MSICDTDDMKERRGGEKGKRGEEGACLLRAPTILFQFLPECTASEQTQEGKKRKEREKKEEKKKKKKKQNQPGDNSR